MTSIVKRMENWQQTKRLRQMRASGPLFWLIPHQAVHPYDLVTKETL
jgi:hypothetical protein